MTEAELIVATRAGKSWGIAGLYRAHGAALYRTMYRLTGSHADAEDLVHDVFVGLPEALRRYEERGAFAAWLHRLAVRAALMRLRAVRRRGEVPLDAPRPSAVPRPADRAVEIHEVWRAVDALPESLRSVFVLKQVEGYSHEEVAALLGITRGASRVRLNRALRRLQQALT